MAYVVTRLAAYSVRGLERIGEEELRDTLPAYTLLSISPKLVRFESAWDPRAFSALRTIDDLGIELADPTTITTDDELRTLIAELPIDTARQIIESARPLDSDEISVTVTARSSQLGNQAAIQAVVADTLRQRKVGLVVDGRRGSLDLRVFVDAETVSVSARVFDKPLFHRSYRRAVVVGAIRPTVAAAMLRLMSPKPGQSIWDPFCGSGTILCEAALLHLPIAGGDYSPDAIAAARTNLEAIDPRLSTVPNQIDARNTPQWRANVDSLLVTNLPWNQQVRITRGLNGEIGDALGRRMSVGGAGVCILTTRPDRVMRIAQQRSTAVLDVHQGNLGVLGQVPTLTVVETRDAEGSTPSSRSRRIASLLQRVETPEYAGRG